jgi:hypothetical protein
MHSGQLARLTGLSTDTLRHYERLGLLPPESAYERCLIFRMPCPLNDSLTEL